jgi:hypothetical protein
MTCLTPTRSHRRHRGRAVTGSVVNSEPPGGMQWTNPRRKALRQSHYNARVPGAARDLSGQWCRSARSGAFWESRLFQSWNVERGTPSCWQNAVTGNLVDCCRDRRDPRLSRTIASQPTCRSCSRTWRLPLPILQALPALDNPPIRPRRSQPTSRLRDRSFVVLSDFVPRFVW